MHTPSYRAMRAAAIVSLVLAAASAPCTLHPAAAAAEPAAVTTPRQRVSEPMVWMVPTATGWQTAEHAQPTLWLDGQPHTRYWVDRPGTERALMIGR